MHTRPDEPIGQFRPPHVKKLTGLFAPSLSEQGWIRDKSHGQQAQARLGGTPLESRGAPLASGEWCSSGNSTSGAPLTTLEVVLL
jgi:hypothetical protein